MVEACFVSLLLPLEKLPSQTNIIPDILLYFIICIVIHAEGYYLYFSFKFLQRVITYNLKFIHAAVEILCLTINL